VFKVLRVIERCWAFLKMATLFLFKNIPPPRKCDSNQKGKGCKREKDRDRMRVRVRE